MHRVTRTYADPLACPACGAAIEAPTRCPGCGLSLAGPVAAELFRTLQHADQLLARLRAEPTPMTPVAAPVAPAPAAPAPPQGAPVFTEAAPRRNWTVPLILLTLGGLCLAVGGLLFIAVAWYILGPSGRTAVLVLMTVGAGVATGLVARRGLALAAETLAAVTAAFLTADLLGARLAGWVDVAWPSWLVVTGTVVALACSAGLLALRGTGLRLTLLQCVGAGAADLAALSALSLDSPAATGTVMAVAGLGAALALRRADQPIVRWNACAVALLGWLEVALVGLGRTLDSLPTHDADAIVPLVVAGLLAAPLASPSRLVPAAPYALRVVGGVVAGWLFVLAASAWFVDSLEEAVVVAAVVAVGAAALALLLPPRASLAGVFRWLATTAAGGTALVALAWLVALGWAVLRAVEEGLRGTGDWLLDYERWLVDHPAPWTAAVAGAAVAAAVATWDLGRVRSAGPLTWLTAAVLAVGAAVLGHVTLAIAVVGVLGVAAVLQVLAVLTAGRRAPHWVAASVLAAAALAVATYDTAVLAVTALLVAAVAAVVLAAGSPLESRGAALALPPLVGLAAATTASVRGLSAEDGALAAIGTVLLVALSVGLLGWARRLGEEGHRLLYAATLATTLALTALGAGARENTAWASLALTGQAAAAAVLGIRHRSRLIGAAASALGLVALWLRLGDQDVTTPEAYTLPLAAVVLAFGGWAFWRDRSTRSWPMLGPGIGLAVVPPLVLALGDPVSLRALWLGAGCVALVAVGAACRWQAPLVISAAALALLVLAELAPYAVAWSWFSISVVGLGLLLAGVLWEHLASAGRRTWGHVADLR